MAHRLLLFAIVALLAVFAGVIAAMRWVARPSADFTTSDGRRLVITDITIGTPLNATEAQKINPKLRHKDYTTADPLALRLTTDSSVTEPYTVSVRLLAANGGVVELAPSHATFQPGTSTYCCWTVAQPGSYTWQIFRPEQIITSVPLRIGSADRSTGRGNPLLKP